MGYDTDKDRNLVINPDEAKIVRRIFREFEEGWTPSEIARRLNAEKVNPLQSLRARQMIELTAQGILVNEVPELTRMVLERVVIHDIRHFTVRFLDGTVREVCVTE